jgi:predicted metal-dependent hydrolase
MDLPTYKHIINPKLKNIYLHVDKDGEVVIKSPRVPIEKIERFLIAKAKWINSAREKILNKKGNPQFENNNINIYYLGKQIDVVIKESTANKLDFIDNEFTLMFTDKNKDMLHKTIDKFYLARAKLTLPIIVEKWSQTIGLEHTKLRFRKTKRQWGSCNNKNEICLNSSLMKLPPYLIDYVIIHELCHIKHKHHQKSFWDEVGIFCPNFKKYRAQLKEFSV